MGTHKERRLRRLAAAGLISILLTSGCAGPAIGTGSEPSTQQAERIEVEEAWRSMQKTAAEELNRYLWPWESVQKTILGEEIEFILYHGNGWTIHVPASWEEHHTGLAGEWESPSHCASFSVSQQFWGINNPKWYRAQQGSWRHETDYAPPFDYYYDNDGGYTPPAGSCDYIYFFAPDGEKRSYEFTLQTVVDETTEEETAVQEAMLLSFHLDETSHVLNSQAYSPGKTEWDAAMAGLMAEKEPLGFSWFHNITLTETDGKGRLDYVSYVMDLADFNPEEFTETFFGNRPEGAEKLKGDSLTLCLPEMGMWLYFYPDSPWVEICHAGRCYWSKFSHKDDPDKMIFDTAHAWLEAELMWAADSTESSDHST